MLPLDPEEKELLDDPRFSEAVDQFNAGDWYACHDGLEELWHETSGVCRPVLQGILQIAVGQLHFHRSNVRGALILTGEGLGRLKGVPDDMLGLDLGGLRQAAQQWLTALQNDESAEQLLPPVLSPAGDRVQNL